MGKRVGGVVGKGNGKEKEENKGKRKKKKNIYIYNYGPRISCMCFHSNGAFYFEKCFFEIFFGITTYFCFTFKEKKK